MTLDLKSIELFIRVAATGAIGKAGAEFGLSATAATQRIKALEKAVGAPLLHRSTRRVSLSADGEVFLLHAKRIVADIEDALADVQTDPTQIAGELRVTGSASFGRKHIAPHIAAFIDAHPKLTVTLHLTDAVFDIVENGFDLAIRLGTLAPSSLKARKIAESPRIIVAAPAYLARFPAPRTPAELAAHNCLKRGDVRSWSFAGPDGAAIEAKVAGNFATNFAEAVTEAAVAGLGVARKCRWEIADQLASGALTPILEDYAVTPAWDVFAVRPPAPRAPARVRAFTEFLAAIFRETPTLQAR